MSAPVQALAAAAGVVRAAWERECARDPLMQGMEALDCAGMLRCPETAWELVSLRRELAVQQAWEQRMRQQHAADVAELARLRRLLEVKDRTVDEDPIALTLTVADRPCPECLGPAPEGRAYCSQRCRNAADRHDDGGE